MWIYMCGPGCDWCHRASVRMPARYTGNKSIPCCTNNTIPFEHSSSQLQGAWKVFLWEVFHDMISHVHAAKLFMNNVHNPLFTLIKETAFENSLFSSEASSLPQSFLCWLSRRKTMQALSRWLLDYSACMLSGCIVLSWASADILWKVHPLPEMCLVLTSLLYWVQA